MRHFLLAQAMLKARAAGKRVSQADESYRAAKAELEAAQKEVVRCDDELIALVHAIVDGDDNIGEILTDDSS